MKAETRGLRAAGFLLCAWLQARFCAGRFFGSKFVRSYRWESGPKGPSFSAASSQQPEGCCSLHSCNFKTGVCFLRNRNFNMAA